MAVAGRRPGTEADFFFSTGPYSDEELKVIRFEGSEGMSELFSIRLQLAMEDPEADFEALLGKPALLRIEGRQGTRYISGIVSRFEQSSERTRMTQYSAELVPRIWFLGHRRNSRIFQETTVPDIIRKVLTDAMVPPDQFKFSLQQKYVKREYCVQYRESDLAFVSRLMEEEGIYYWFEHSEGKHVLVIGDAASAHGPIQGDEKLIFQEATGEEPELEHIYHFRYSEQVRPGEVVLRDFDFKKPMLDLTSKKAADLNTELQVYDYPGEYTHPSVGSSWSEVRLQELQSARRIGLGKTNCRRFIPGCKFTMEQHARPKLNRQYLLTRVHHKGSQVQALKEAAGAAQANEYQCEYECIPSDVQFRARRLTPRPVVHGSQTAIVTGPKGEEIYPDEHGRVKVQFHWDREGKRDEKSSCWIRVSQSWAGAGWGAMIIPRIGQEVIVDFLEGDPDQPIITGRVYNGDNRVPFALPGGKSQAGFKSNSTLGGGGYNELILDDTKGNELIRIHGQYDLDSTIEHDLREHVLNDRTRDVTNNEGITIGGNQTYSIAQNQRGNVDVDKFLMVGSNHTETIGANMTLTVGGVKSETVTMASSEKIGLAKLLAIGAGYQVGVGGAMNETVGAAKIEEVGGARIEAVGAYKKEAVRGKKNVSIGSDLTEEVKGQRICKVTGNVTEVLDADHDETVAGKFDLDAKEILLTGTDKIVLTCGSSSITLESGGTIRISGKNIELEASGEIGVIADGKLEMAGSNFELKSTSGGGKIVASAILETRGSMVKINC